MSGRDGDERRVRRGPRGRRNRTRPSPYDQRGQRQPARRRDRRRPPSTPGRVRAEQPGDRRDSPEQSVDGRQQLEPSADGRRPPERSIDRRHSSASVPGRDPVQAAFVDRVDLYDIATWEVRSSLDSLAVSVTTALRTGRTVLLVALALGLFVLQAAVAVLIVLEEPFVGLLAVSSAVPALAVAGYLWYGDPTRREPLVTLAATFVLSVLFASFAGVVNSVVGPSFEAFGILGLVVFYFVVVGPIEEFVKWLAVRTYAYRHDAFRTVVDGVVYGAVAGLGFATIENLIYIVNVYLEAGETAGLAPTEAATRVAAQRFVVGPGHVVFSAWAGFYLGLAKFNPENRGPIVVKGLLIAAFIHALYNTSVSILPGLLPAVGAFGFILLYHGFWFALLYRKVRRYRELYLSEFPDGRAARRSPDRRDARPAGHSGHVRRARQSRRSRERPKSPRAEGTGSQHRVAGRAEPGSRDGDRPTGR